MGSYSIKELEKLSGIKAHTIRIWEKRYNVITPERTPTNIRYYSDDDLKKIINISILNNHGHKISKISQLTQDEISKKVAELALEDSDFDLLIDELTLCMIELNEIKFGRLLSDYVNRFGLEKTVLEIVYPFLEKIGILWLANNISPVQEHFISHLVRQKIIVATDGLPLNEYQEQKKVILFLPENELHELGLLFYNFLLKKAGYFTYYLGQSVPLEDLKQVANDIEPHYLLTHITSSPKGSDLEEFVALLSTKFHTSEVYISGQPLININTDPHKNIHKFKNAKDLKNIFSGEVHSEIF